MKRLWLWCVRCALTPLLALAWSSGTAVAFTNIPAGTTVWLQGYNGGQVSPGFAIDGTLRLETIDEPLIVGVSVAQPDAITNNTDGLILCGAGAGGDRYIYGNVVNSGTIHAAYPLSFDGPGAKTINYGQVVIDPGSGLAATGVGGEFDMMGGGLVIPFPSSYFNLVDGTFSYQGGLVQGLVSLYRSTAVLSDGATNPIALTLTGPGCRFDGKLTDNRVITVQNSLYFDPVAVTFTNLTEIDGTLSVAAALATVSLRLPESGVTIGTNGSMAFEASAEEATVAGGFANWGSLRIEAPVHSTSLAGPSGGWMTNGGACFIAGQGQWTIDGGLLIAGGSVTMQSATLTAPSGVDLAGGALNASGTIGGNLTNAALLQIAQLPSLNLSSNYDYVQTPAGVLQITAGDALGGLATPALTLAGQAQLAGKLSVQNSGPAPQTAGTVLSILSAASISGAFSGIELPPLGPGLSWTNASTTNAVQFIASGPLLVVTGITGGANLQLTGATNAAVSLEVSTNLLQWSRVWTTNSFPGSGRIPAPADAGPRAYYRVLAGPAGTTP